MVNSARRQSYVSFSHYRFQGFVLEFKEPTLFRYVKILDLDSCVEVITKDADAYCETDSRKHTYSPV